MDSELRSGDFCFSLCITTSLVPFGAFLIRQRPTTMGLPTNLLDMRKKICYSCTCDPASRRNPLASSSTQSGNGACDFKIEAQLMRHSNILYTYVQRRIPAGLRSTVSPEDILQEVWMVAANKIADSQRSDEVGAWLMNATKNKLADAIKRAVAVKRGGRNRFEYNVRPASSSGLEPFALAASTQRTPSSEDAAREAASAVRCAVRVLPSEYREAVTLRYLDEESVPAIALRMRNTVPATRGLLYRGIRMLRRRLGPAWRFFSDDGSVNTNGGSRHDDQ